LQDLISKITRAKWTGDVAQAIKPALQAQSPEFIPQSHQKKKNNIAAKQMQKSKGQS
jgi:hypothetical protein